MTILTTYMVRKPTNLDEVVEMTLKYGRQESERVEITETIVLDEKTYNEVIENPMAEYDFLDGKGGYGEYGREVVRLTCQGKLDLLVDPAGYSYCRYLGIVPKEKKDILESLIMYEINLGTKIVDILKEMKFIEIPSYSVLNDSYAWCWLENEPTVAEKKKVLTALGYDLSKL